MARTLNADTAASSAPKPGHNMPPEIIQQWFGDIVALDKDLQDANEELKKARSTLASKYKLFKDAGGNIKVMKRLVRERNIDRSEVALDKATEEAYREALNMVIDTGGDLFDLADAKAKHAARTTSSDDAEHAKLDSAKDKGYAAAKGGKTRDDNPFSFESDEWDSWNKGWDSYAMDAVSGGKKGSGSTRSRKKPGAEAGATAH